MAVPPLPGHDDTGKFRHSRKFQNALPTFNFSGALVESGQEFIMDS